MAESLETLRLNEYSEGTSDGKSPRVTRILVLVLEIGKKVRSDYKSVPYGLTDKVTNSITF